VGTLLDRDNPAYEALLQKQSYEGPVTLFGHRYERYAPLLDAGGQLLGALIVCVSAALLRWMSGQVTGVVHVAKGPGIQPHRDAGL
jgi:hypothetical protein